MPTTCCVVKCGSRGIRDIIKFFKIPSVLHFAHKTELNELSKIRRQRWIEAIRREDLTEVKLKYAKVCAKHFLKGKPAALTDNKNPDWVPSLVMGYGNETVIKIETGIDRQESQERAKKRRMVIDEDSLEDGDKV